MATHWNHAPFVVQASACPCASPQSSRPCPVR